MPVQKFGKLSLEKNQFIVNRLSKFEELINSSAVSLSETLLEDFLQKLNSEDGELLNEPDNVRRTALIDKAWKKFQETEGMRIIAVFVKDLSDIQSLGKKYYTELIPDAVTPADIEAIINEKLGLKWDGGEWTPKPNGYIDALIKDRTIVTELKKIAYNNIIGKAGPETLKKEFKNYLIGQGENPGEFYKFYDNFTFDTYSEVDRLNSKLHADRLGLTYFLFGGGIIADSRQFCIDHHGKCFSTLEAESWRDLIGKYKLVPGKVKKEIKVPIGPIVEDKDTYEPVKDLGGIRCRHSADFVSLEIAKHFRPDL